MSPWSHWVLQMPRYSQITESSHHWKAQVFNASALWQRISEWIKCLLNVTSAEKRFLAMHHVAYIYARLCSVPHRPGFTLWHLVSQNHWFNIPMYSLVFSEGEQNINFRDITVISFCYPTLLPVAPALQLHCNCLFCKHEQPRLCALPHFWFHCVPPSERVELCIDMVFLCVSHHDCTAT